MGKKSLDKQIAKLNEESKLLKVKEAEFLKQQEIDKEKAKVEIKEEIKPYKVFGRDFSTTDPKYIEFYKNRAKMMAVEYKLVGKVDDNSNYIIPKQIKYDLVAMRKAIEEMADDYYKVSALYMKKHFNFTIKLVMTGDGKARASLYIAEYVGGFVDGEMIYSHIADFVDVFDAEYRNKLRKVFNLVDADAKNNDFDVPNLAVLMQDYIDMDLYIGGLYDMASQIYIIRLLKLLEESGEGGLQIIELYNKILGELLDGENKEKPQFINEKKKEFLDKIIDSFGGFDKLSVDKKQLGSIIDEINKTHKAIGAISVAGVSEIDIPDNIKEKSEGKNSGGSKKKSAKKKAGGDNKKSSKPKKKDSKKKKEEKKKGPGVDPWASDTSAQDAAKSAVGDLSSTILGLIFSRETPEEERPPREGPDRTHRRREESGNDRTPLHFTEEESSREELRPSTPESVERNERRKDMADLAEEIEEEEFAEELADEVEGEESVEELAGEAEGEERKTSSSEAEDVSDEESVEELAGEAEGEDVSDEESHDKTGQTAEDTGAEEFRETPSSPESGDEGRESE